MNPKGQHLFEIYTRLSYVRVASDTSHTLPCLNTKQVAVKVISKDQQSLILYTKIYWFKLLNNSAIYFKSSYYQLTFEFR